MIDTRYPFSALVDRLEAAVRDKHMVLVNSASASEGAKAAGIHILGNRIVCVFETISLGACWMQLYPPASRRQFTSM